MELPSSRAEGERLISERVQENLHLEYKRSDHITNGKTNEITKGVSGFANSDGGLILYGVVEKDHLPVSIDGGVDHSTHSREWLEQILSTNINPRISDLGIAQIPLSPERSLYAIKVPRSERGPHQAQDKKYYRRFNFTSVPMEDYEINDVRNRREVISPLLSVDVEIRRGRVFLIIMNTSRSPAEDVTFGFSGDLRWSHRVPSLFARGARSIPPGRIMRFFYNRFVVICGEGSQASSQFSIDVSYKNPLTGGRVTDSFHIDLMDYMDSFPLESEIYELGNKLKDGFDKLAGEVAKLGEPLSNISRISGATGLDLSVSALRNLKQFVMADGEISKMDPALCGEHAFKEVLGVDDDMASRLYTFFSYGNRDKNIDELEGMTGELAKSIRTYFLL